MTVALAPCENQIRDAQAQQRAGSHEEARQVVAAEPSSLGGGGGSRTIVAFGPLPVFVTAVAAVVHAVAAVIFVDALAVAARVLVGRVGGARQHARDVHPAVCHRQAGTYTTKGQSGRSQLAGRRARPVYMCCKIGGLLPRRPRTLAVGGPAGSSQRAVPVAAWEGSQPTIWIKNALGGQRLNPVVVEADLPQRGVAAEQAHGECPQFVVVQEAVQRAGWQAGQVG